MWEIRMLRGEMKWWMATAPAARGTRGTRDTKGTRGTRGTKKITQPLGSKKKIMQLLGPKKYHATPQAKKNHATSQAQKNCAPFQAKKKSRNLLGPNKNHATSWAKKNQGVKFSIKKNIKPANKYYWIKNSSNFPWKLDVVGPVDNRPSTNRLHHFVKKERKKVTCNTWHVTRDMWRDTWHMTCDMFGGANILSKFRLPSSYGLWFMISWISEGKGWVN